LGKKKAFIFSRREVWEDSTTGLKEIFHWGRAFKGFKKFSGKESLPLQKGRGLGKKEKVILYASVLKETFKKSLAKGKGKIGNARGTLPPGKEQQRLKEGKNLRRKGPPFHWGKEKSPLVLSGKKRWTEKPGELR